MTLTVIVDQIIAPVPGGTGRYTEELTRALIDTAPRGTSVVGYASASPASDTEKLLTLLPGIASIEKPHLNRANLRRAWRNGFGRLHGMVHSPSLLAPLVKHDRLNNPGDQTAVTIHDVLAWTHPHVIDPRRARWHRAMVKRAHRYADAVVVPSHTVAAQLNDFVKFGDRVRVIGGAISSKLQLPVDPAERAARLGLPDQYLLTVGTLEPHKGIEPLIRSLAHPDSVNLPLIIAGPAGWGGIDVDQLAADAGLAPGRVRAVGFLQDADLATAIAGATVFVHPSLADGFGLSVIEAFSLGTPVVHSDAPALVEVSADAGISVEIGDADGYPARLAQTIAEVVADDTKREHLRLAGLDRASAFSWRDSAERVWELHADL